VDSPRLGRASCWARVPELGLQNLTLNFCTACVGDGAAGLTTDGCIGWTRLDDSGGQTKQSAEGDQSRRHVTKIDRSDML
jgi:hypothetical protein